MIKHDLPCGNFVGHSSSKAVERREEKKRKHKKGHTKDWLICFFLKHFLTCCKVKHMCCLKTAISLYEVLCMCVCVSCACVSSLTPLVKPLVVFRAKLCPKSRVDPSGLPSTLQSCKQHYKFLSGSICVCVEVVCCSSFKCVFVFTW